MPATCAWAAGAAPSHGAPKTSAMPAPAMLMNSLRLRRCLVIGALCEAAASVGAFVVDEVFRKLLLQSFDLGQVADLDVGVAGVLQGKILVIVFAPVESLQRRNLRNDAIREDLGRVELRDVCRGDALLFLIDIKDSGTVRRADVRPLAIQLRRIVSHGKKDAKQLAIRDFGGIVDHFDGFRVAGSLGDHLPVSGGLGGAASIARGGLEYSLDALKDGLSSPKTATGKDGRLLARRRGDRRIKLGRRNRRVCGFSREGHNEDCKADG